MLRVSPAVSAVKCYSLFDVRVPVHCTFLPKFGLISRYFSNLTFTCIQVTETVFDSTTGTVISMLTLSSVTEDTACTCTVKPVETRDDVYKKTGNIFIIGVFFIQSDRCAV